MLAPSATAIGPRCPAGVRVLTPATTTALLFLHLHGSIHVALRLLIVVVERLLALSIEHRSAALVLGHAAELIVQITAIHLAVRLILTVIIVASNDSTLVVKGVIA